MNYKRELIWKLGIDDCVESQLRRLFYYMSLKSETIRNTVNIIDDNE